MIIFPRFGYLTSGRLGNNMYQWMAMIGLSKRYDTTFAVPPWKYSDYFGTPPPQIAELPEIQSTMMEPVFHYNIEAFDQYDFKNINISIFGWLQSEQYWADHKDDVRKAIQFKQSFIDSFDKPTFSRPTIAISVRRGDYTSLNGYHLLPGKYYIMALLEQFPDFREKYQLMIFSDDIDFCRLHFGCLENVWYADGLSDIQQLYLLSTADNFILANSTFSMVGAFIAELNGCNGKIIHSGCLFENEMAEKNDSRDFYPSRWHRFDYRNNKINLKDVTFTIPVSYDSRDRKENVDMCLKYLSDFDTTIIIGEHGPHPRFEYTRETGCQYMRFDMQAFHRTKMLNDMALAAKTSIVANWDADVIVPPMQLIEAVHKIKTRQAQMVYPYDGQFARVPRQQWYQQVMKMGDVGVFAGQKFQGMGTAPKSVGGAILWDMEAFVDCGLENEKMVSYAPEDAERYYRAEKLGVKVHRVDGVIYHLDHLITNNSSIQHEHYRDNMIEYHTIKGMSKEELRTCVDAWPWKKNYTPLYYESIFEESVKSRDVVFKYLWALELLRKCTLVIDAGCGIGSWGYQLKDKFGVNYLGIDFGVPVDKLVIPPHQYLDFDLRKDIDTVDDRSNCLVLSLEVGEHIEEDFIDTYLNNLCKLGDTVVFSAAIPNQGGLHHHTERWQSWWVEKFAKRGYQPLYMDIRPLLRKNPDVCRWYSQNMVIYQKRYIAGMTDLGDVYTTYELDFIDPKMYENTLKHYRIWK